MKSIRDKIKDELIKIGVNVYEGDEDIVLQMNSIEFMCLICNLEKSFNINFEYNDIAFDKFCTIKKIEKMVSKC